MSREHVFSQLSTANVRKHVEHITKNIPTRLAGSANGKRMAEYSLQVLRDAGAEARMHELPGLVSFPEKADMRVLAPREIAIEANTLGHSVPTLADGISGELMDVGSGAGAELPDAEARWMLETQLVRDRNRVADALDDSRNLIDATLQMVAR